MDLLSIILLTLVILWIIAAVAYLIHHRGAPCCTGGKCAQCSGHCKHCSK